MKRFLLLIIVAGLAYAGYQYYLQYGLGRGITPPEINLSDKLNIRQSNLGDFADVLGVATSNLFESGKDILDNITDKDGEMDGDDVHAAAHTLSEQVNSAVWTSGAEDDDLIAELLDEGEDDDGVPKLPVYPENTY